jgi:nucleotide-binding universal stress UspA family protein
LIVPRLTGDGRGEVAMMNHRRGKGWIVVGLDGNDGDQAVLAVALRQAAQSGSRVCVVHALGVVDVQPGAVSRAAVRRWAAVQDSRTSAATQDLRRAVEDLAADFAPAVGIEYEVDRGDPATALLAAAAEVDLIVLGTRTDGTAPPLLLGTVSQDVAVHARCPILLVPPGAGRC